MQIFTIVNYAGGGWGAGFGDFDPCIWRDAFVGADRAWGEGAAEPAGDCRGFFVGGGGVW